jgi:hypothetical protein
MLTAEQYFESLATEAHQFQKAYKYLDFDGGMAMLRNGTVRFTSACNLNDDYDCNTSIINYDSYREIGRSLGIDKLVIEQTILKEGEKVSHWGVCSLCKTAANDILWNNYANKGGICIELDVPLTINALANKGKIAPLIPVEYYDEVAGLIDRNLGIASNDLFRHILIKRIVSSKSRINATNGWPSYKEDEIRLVLFERVESRNPLNVTIPHSCISAVYFDDALAASNLRTLHQLTNRKYSLVPIRKKY